MSDLISRQAAIDAIGKYNFEFPDYMERFVTELRDAMKADLKHDIKALPSAQPEKVCIAKITLSEEQVREAVEKAKNEVVRELPSAHPEIIRCRNCKFASGDSRICMKFGHSPIGELDFCAWAERRTDE